MSDFKIVSVLNPTVVLTAGPAISAGTSSQATGTISFSNSNGVSFGLSNGVLTASAAGGGGGGGGGVAISAGTNSTSTGTVVFSNSNGVSFGMNTNGVVTGTVATNYQSQGAYLTTAMASNRGSDFVQATAAFAGTNASGTVASNGISVSVGNYITTAMASNRGSDFVQATAAFAGTNASGTIASNGVSVSVAAQSVQPVAASASNGSFNFSTLKFVEGSGVTWATQAGGIQASVKTDYQSQGAYLTTAMQSGASTQFVQGNAAFFGTNASGTIASNAISISVNAGGPGGGGVAISAGTNSTSTGTVVFSNASGVTFGMDTNGVVTATVATNYQSQGAYLTTAAQSNQVVNSINGSTGIFSFNTGSSLSSSRNGNSITFGLASNITTALQSTGDYLTTARASNDAIGLNTAVTNVTATINSSGFSFNAAGYAGTGTSATNASITLNSNGLAISVAAPGGGGGAINVSAGTTSGNLQTIQFNDGNGVSFGLDGSTVTASINAGSADPLLLTYVNRQLGASVTTQWTNNQLWLAPFRLAGGSLSASTMQVIQSISGTYTSAVAATWAQTLRWALYSNNTSNSTRFDTWQSGSFTMNYWNSGTSSGSYAVQGTTSSSAGTAVLSLANGVRIWPIDIATTIPAGLYAMGVQISTASTGYSGLQTRFAMIMDNPAPLAMGLGVGSVTVSSTGYVDGGTFSVTTTSPPASFGFSQIRQHSNVMPFFKIGAL